MNVALSLGSNIDRYRHIAAGVDALKAEFGAVRCSPVYESDAVGFQGDAFLNLIVLVDSELGLTAINKKLKSIEDRYGRDRSQPKFSSRTLDIDVVTYGDHFGEVEGVALPRPELFRNAHVLRPMKDLLPDDYVPGTNQTYAALYESASFDDQRLAKVDFNWR